MARTCQISTHCAALIALAAAAGISRYDPEPPIGESVRSHFATESSSHFPRPNSPSRFACNLGHWMAWCEAIVAGAFHRPLLTSGPGKAKSDSTPVAQCAVPAEPTAAGVPTDAATDLKLPIPAHRHRLPFANGPPPGRPPLPI